jgi:erythromycin esterase-like protein
MGGIFGALGQSVSAAAQEAAWAAATAGLDAAQTAAIQAALKKFTSTYDESNRKMDAQNTALATQIEEFSIAVPSDEQRDKIIDEQLKKPVEGSTAKIRIWGTTLGPSGS